MPIGRTPRLLVIAFSYNALLATWLLWHPASASLVKGVDNIAQFAGMLLFLPVCFTGWRKLPFRLFLRRGSEIGGLQDWVPILLGFGILSWALGQAIYSYYEEILLRPTPLPSWADAGYLGVYPFLLVGIILLFGQSLTVVSRTRIVLDGLMIMTALFTVSWYFILGPTLLQATDSFFGKLVGTAYPASDLVLAACLLIFATRRHDPVLRQAGSILVVALTVIVFTDSIFDYRSLQGTYATGSLVDIGWPLGYMLIAVGADMVRRRPVGSLQSGLPGSVADPPTRRRTGMIWRSLLPYLLVPLVAGLAIFALVAGRKVELQDGVFLGGAVLIGLVVIRQILVILENAHLYDDVQRTNDKLEALSTTDPLTDLPNHRALMNALDLELERSNRYRRPCSLIVLDLDHFKALNDGLGHAGGDAALREFAAIIRQRLRSIDILARWGGEEFVAILPETDLDGAVAAAEDVRVTLAGQAFSVGGGIHLTCSLGVASFPQHGDTRDLLLEVADRAMYTAKRLGRNQVRAAGDRAIDDVDDETDRPGSRGETALLGTVEALAAMVDARDHYTGDHSQKVATLGARLASALVLDAAQIRLVILTGRLHDVGKVAIPDVVLQKAGRLTKDEWTIMRQHPAIGADVVSRVPALRVLAPAIRSHQEWWNGQGYPDGLIGTQIPQIARIVSVADAYGAMTNDRPYRQKCSPSAALKEIRRCAGTQFDPEVVAALERISRVEGTAEHLAVVV